MIKNKKEEGNEIQKQKLLQRETKKHIMSNNVRQ